MTAPLTSSESTPDVPAASSGIPVRNWWYMLLYAWNELRLKDRWRAEVENAPTVDALLGMILGNLVEQRIRIGLGRDYRDHEALIHGIRGRVDFGQSLRRMAFEKGKACCRFQTYSANVPKNQIVRSTLAWLTLIGDFGPDATRGEQLRHRLRGLVRELEMVDLIELKPEFVRRQQLQRQDADYRLMLSICSLLLQCRMPTETAGTDKVPGLDQEAMILWRVFETFVANFYRCHLTDWTVTAQPVFKWHESRTSPFLPVMRPDVVLTHPASATMIVIDTKFSARSLTTGRWGGWRFQQEHLYQIYAYLKSQEHLSARHRGASGILLYPTVSRKLSEHIDVQEHTIRWETVDLALPWERIEKNLLRMICGADDR